MCFLVIQCALKLQFEWNARTQITMWYDNTEVEASLLRDYGKGISTTLCVSLPSLLEKLASSQIWRLFHAHPLQMDMSLEVVITG